MARPLRIEYPNAFYHVLSRGERKDNIFRSDRDRNIFIEKLSETCRKFSTIVHAYALMNNHYHLLIETPKANLSRSLHYLNASYANWFRKKYELVGSVFQGRYKAILVDKDSYLTLLSAYIHLNPCRAGVVKKPEDFKWSSYRYYMDKGSVPEWINRQNILSGFMNNQRLYREYVESQGRLGGKSDQKNLYGKNSILGGSEFVKVVMRKVKGKLSDNDKREIPHYKKLSYYSLVEIRDLIRNEYEIEDEDMMQKRKGNRWRRLFIYELWKYTEMSLKEIGELFRMDYSAVSQNVRRIDEEIRSKGEMKELVSRLERAMKVKISAAHE
jgi:REP element-mobilizing transposase RayT